MTEDELSLEAQLRRDRASRYFPDCHPFLAIGQAAGSWLYDLKGSRWLDFGDGGRVNLLGHCYPGVRQAVENHLDRYWYPGSVMDVASLYPARYAELLSSRFPAVEGQPRQVVVCGSPCEAYAVAEQISGGHAVTLRPVSESHSLDGGMVQDIVHQARALGKLVIADETVTGFGRTGTFLAVDHYNFDPDIVVLGPAGGGGLPFAAVVAPAALFARVTDVGPVFTSPLICAAAYGVLASLTDAVLANVVEMGTLLEQAVIEVAEQFPDVERVTGRGLLRQVHLTRPADTERFRRECSRRGLLMSDNLTLTPPLTVTADEVRAAADVMAEVLMEWKTA